MNPQPASEPAAAFINWESPHVHPLEVTPDGAYLLAVNTPDARLEIFSLATGTPVPLAAVPVGLDPVTVRARTNSEFWVVNHVSDSVSIVDLDTRNVVRTLYTGDEPADVVFAGAPQRAFVSLGQKSEIRVYDPADLSLPPIVLSITGESPRALATDGDRVFAAIFESGNRTTILSPATVSSAHNPYPGRPNPPPNDGIDFNPPPAAGLPQPPPVGLIVRRGVDGTWRDDNSADWSAAVRWNVVDHDVAMIDAATLSVSYVSGLMTFNMALAVHPSGAVIVVGVDSLNHIRFESNVAGVFARVQIASFDPGAPESAAVADLNPHLTYTSSSAPQALRALSIGDPRGIVWSPAGNRAYITGMGSNNVVVLDEALARLSLIEVGSGPTGVVLDPLRGSAYVLNKFEASISVVDTMIGAEVSRVSFFDPTPIAVREGRKHLYNTHATSGLGHVSCATCHVDARSDGLAWDLGKPSGQVFRVDAPCLDGGCPDWHPMKGPMITQTLVGITQTEPLHWRGDRQNLAAFNATFVDLLGGDGPLPPAEFESFEAFVSSLAHPPNPNLALDGTFPSVGVNGGNVNTGYVLFTFVPLQNGVATCSSCHAIGNGVGPTVMVRDGQTLGIPQLRDLYRRTGFDMSSPASVRGFGFTHDGSVGTLAEILLDPSFTFAPGAAGVQQRRDVEAFLLAFSSVPAAIGAQVTIRDAALLTPDEEFRIATLHQLAVNGKIGLVARGLVAGEPRGYVLVGPELFQSDRAGETATLQSLLQSATTGAEVTLTGVPLGSETRIGLDRDGDGFYDGDEIAGCSDPSDPLSTPPACPSVLLGDLNCDGVISAGDIAGFVIAITNPGQYAADYPSCRILNGDINGDGAVSPGDIAGFVALLTGTSSLISSSERE